MPEPTTVLSNDTLRADKRAGIVRTGRNFFGAGSQHQSPLPASPTTPMRSTRETSCSMEMTSRLESSVTQKAVPAVPAAMEEQPNGAVPSRKMPEHTDVDDHQRLEYLERMRRYEDELQKRKQSAEKHSKEQEFLRASLRGSRKLKALEKRSQAVATAAAVEPGLENPAYQSDEPSDSTCAVVHANGFGAASLPERAKSVTRVLVSGDQLTDGRETPEPVRSLLARQDIQSVLREVVQSAKRRNAKSSSTSAVDFPGAKDCAEMVLNELENSLSAATAELRSLLELPEMKAVLQTHDHLARLWLEIEASTSSCDPAKWTELKETSLCSTATGANLKMVKLTKDGDMPLGATVKNNGEAIVIGRIVRGGVAEKSRLLSEGDEIIEVNGVDMRGKSVNEVCDLLGNMTGEITFIVAPVSEEEQDLGADFMPAVSVKHLRSLFNYDPEDDPYLPCRELGLGFSKGDVLHVISVKDPNWWQAYREGEDSTQSLAGLVPSPNFQLQREEYNRELPADDRDKGKDFKTIGLLFKGKKKRLSFMRARKSHSVSLESREILIYEEVSLYLSRTGRRRPIVLIGPPHVGCLELRQRLMETEAEKFAGVVPHTTRPKQANERDGVPYYFVTKQAFQEDADAGKFVEWGEYQKHLYGTSFDEIRRVIQRGRTCIITLKAQSIPVLRNSDLMPYVIFIAPPSLERLKMNKQRHGINGNVKEEELKAIVVEAKKAEELFGHYFDKVIVNYDLEQSFHELRLIIHRLETEPQWVPSVWLKSTNPVTHNLHQ